MAETYINKLQRQLQRKNLANRSNDARKWLFDKAQNMKNIRWNTLGKAYDNLSIGMMYFFVYDPKTKDDLPYYDRLPLVFPIEMYQDGFLGLNLHYLAPDYRAILLDKLTDVATNKKFDDKTRLRLSYDLLAGSKKYRLFEPCLKRYLYSHMKSRFIKIEANEWDIAIYLPVERFVKAKKETVHRESYQAVY
jgi:hypothetical protein